MLPFIAAFAPPGANMVAGKVIGENNQAVINAYVYVIAGEEETLTVKDGQFQLKTWQPLPLTLVVEHGEFEKERILIKRHGRQIIVRLHTKKNP
jgi:thiamine phosphate synthase YjbQ (UPF0047 family)